MNTIKLTQINHKNKKQAQDLTYLLNQYAQDPMGGGKALPKEVLENLADELAKVEEIAKAKGCCKITLEVLSNNEVAKASYSKYGFKGYELDPKVGHAIF